MAKSFSAELPTADLDRDSQELQFRPHLASRDAGNGGFRIEEGGDLPRQVGESDELLAGFGEGNPRPILPQGRSIFRRIGRRVHDREGVVKEMRRIGDPYKRLEKVRKKRGAEPGFFHDNYTKGEDLFVCRKYP